LFIVKLLPRSYLKGYYSLTEQINFLLSSSRIDYILHFITRDSFDEFPISKTQTNDTEKMTKGPVMKFPPRLMTTIFSQLMCFGNI